MRLVKCGSHLVPLVSRFKDPAAFIHPHHLENERLMLLDGPGGERGPQSPKGRWAFSREEHDGMERGR